MLVLRIVGWTARQGDGWSAVEFEATVTDVREEQRSAGCVRWQLLLDHTRFGPGEQGELEAVARSGTRLRLRVLAMVAGDGGELWHVVEKPLAAGTRVRGIVLP